jgi:hypothetical protein
MPGHSVPLAGKPEETPPVSSLCDRCRGHMSKLLEGSDAIAQYRLIKCNSSLQRLGLAYLRDRITQRRLPYSTRRQLVDKFWTLGRVIGPGTGPLRFSLRRRLSREDVDTH